MDAGLYWRCDTYVYEVTGTFSRTRTVGGSTPRNVSGQATVVVRIADSATTVLDHLVLSADVSDNGTASSSVSWTIKDGAGTTVWSGTSTPVGAYSGSIVARMEVDDLRIHKVNIAGFDYWRASWSAIRVYRDASLVGSTGSGYLLSASRVVDDSLPFIGPTAVEADAAVHGGPLLFVANPAHGTYQYSSEVDAEGGFEWVCGATTHRGPVTLPAEAVPPTCPAAPAWPAIGAVDTMTLSAQAWHRDGQPTSTSRVYEYAESGVYGFAEWDRTVERLGPDYAALVYRGGFPSAEMKGWSTCDVDYPFDGAATTTVSTQSYAGADEILARVAEPSHALENPFAAPVRAPMFRTTIRVTMDAAEVLLAGQYSQAFPYLADPYSAVLPHLIHSYGGAGYYGGSNPNPWYYGNTVCSPHASCILWFPPEESGALKSYEWPVVGSRANPQEYWFWDRQQWCYHPALPVDEATARRHDVVVEPMMDGGLTGLFEAWYGQPTSHWGISRFASERLWGYRSASHVLNDADLWSATLCSIAHGADMTVTADPGETEVEIACDLTSWADGPRWASALTMLATLDWADAEVVVWVDGADGTRARMATAPTVDAPWPAGTASVYVGSWARAFGVPLFTVEDLGADLHPDGDSTTWMLSEELASVYGLLPHRNAKRLVFAITMPSPGGVATVAYPEVSQPETEPYVVPETAQVADLVWADGPGLRYGVWSYPTTPPMVPGVHPSFAPPSVYDYLCWRRDAVQGIDSQSGLDAEIAALYDAVEGQDRADAKSETMAPLVQYGTGDPGDPDERRALAMLVNTLAEMPPFRGAPNYVRDWNLVEDRTEPPVLKTWSHVCEARYIVSSRRAAHQYDGASPITSVAAEYPVSKWVVLKHLLALDNTELLSHVVKWGGEDRASVSPWHGWFASTGGVGGAVASAADHRFGLLYDARVDAGVWCRRYEIGGIDDEFQAVVSADVSAAGIAVLPSGEVCIAYADDGDVSRILSYDQGENWSAPVAVGSGTEVAVCADERTGWLFYAYHDGADFVVKRETSIGASLEGPWTILTGSAARIGLVVAPDSHRSLIATIEVGGTIKKYRSTNQGQSWAEV